MGEDRLSLAVQGNASLSLPPSSRYVVTDFIGNRSVTGLEHVLHFMGWDGPLPSVFFTRPVFQDRAFGCT